MRFILLLLVGLSLGFSRVSAHPVHISKCQIQRKANAKTLQVAVSIFIDDLEDALKKEGHSGLYIGTQRQHAQTQKLVFAYLQKKLTFTVNGKLVTYKLLGMEPSEDLAAIWVYLETPKVAKMKSLRIQNRILLELYEDQKNLVYVEPEGLQKHTLIFSRSKEQQQVSW